MNKSVIERITAARQRLETVRHCSGTMAVTFPDYTLAAVMGPDLSDPIVLLSEQRKYAKEIREYMTLYSLHRLLYDDIHLYIFLF